MEAPPLSFQWVSSVGRDQTQGLEGIWKKPQDWIVKRCQKHIWPYNAIYTVITVVVPHSFSWKPRESPLLCGWEEHLPLSDGEIDWLQSNCTRDVAMDWINYRSTKSLWTSHSSVCIIYIYTSDNVLHYISLYIMYTYIWLVVWNMCYFSMYWECHHPNRRSPSFFRGVGEPPTRYICIQGLFLLMSRCDRLHHDPPPWSGCTRQAMDSGYPIIPTFHGSNAQTHGSTCLVVNCCPKMQKLWVILPLCPEMPWIFVAIRHEKWKCSKDAPETLWVNSQIDIKFFHCKCHHSQFSQEIRFTAEELQFHSPAGSVDSRPSLGECGSWRLIQTMSEMSEMSETNLGIAGVA